MALTGKLLRTGPGGENQQPSWEDSFLAQMKESLEKLMLPVDLASPSGSTSGLKSAYATGQAAGSVGSPFPSTGASIFSSSTSTLFGCGAAAASAGWLGGFERARRKW